VILYEIHPFFALKTACFNTGLNAHKAFIYRVFLLTSIIIMTL